MQQKKNLGHKMSLIYQQKQISPLILLFIKRLNYKLNLNHFNFIS
jgi:hypothetical protein